MPAKVKPSMNCAGKDIDSPVKKGIILGVCHISIGKSYLVVKIQVVTEVLLCSIKSTIAVS